MAPAEEAKVPVLIFPVHGLLEVYEREAEAGEEEEECVSLGGRLKEALVCDDGCRGACEVSYRQDLLSGCVGACLLSGEDVPGGDLLLFVWMGMGEEAGEAGLRSGILVVFSALKARSSVWRLLLFRS